MSLVEKWIQLQKCIVGSDIFVYHVHSDPPPPHNSPPSQPISAHCQARSTSTQKPFTNIHTGLSNCCILTPSSVIAEAQIKPAKFLRRILLNFLMLYLLNFPMTKLTYLIFAWRRAISDSGVYPLSSSGACP